MARREKAWGVGTETDQAIELTIFGGAAKSDEQGDVRPRHRYSSSARGAMIALEVSIGDAGPELREASISRHRRGEAWGYQVEVDGCSVCRYARLGCDESHGPGWRSSGEAYSDECADPLALAICRALLDYDETDKTLAGLDHERRERTKE